MHRQRSIPKELKIRKISHCGLRSPKYAELHVVLFQRTSKICTKFQNARAEPLFCLLKFLFVDALVVIDRRRGLLKLPNGRPGAALFTSLSQAKQYATLLPAVNGLVLFKHWAFIASRQFPSQAFRFSVNATGTTHFHHAFRCQQWLWIVPGALVPRGRALFGRSAPKGARPLGARMLSQSRNCICKAFQVRLCKVPVLSTRYRALSKQESTERIKCSLN